MSVDKEEIEVVACESLVLFSPYSDSVLEFVNSHGFSHLGFSTLTSSVSVSMHYHRRVFSFFLCLIIGCGRPPESLLYPLLI